MYTHTQIPHTHAKDSVDHPAWNKRPGERMWLRIALQAGASLYGVHITCAEMVAAVLRGTSHATTSSALGPPLWWIVERAM